MVEEKAPITIHLNLSNDDIIQPLLGVLNDIKNNLLFGLNLLTHSNIELVSKIDFFENRGLIDFGKGDNNPEIIKENFKNWLITKALEDLIKGLQFSIGKALGHCKLIRLICKNSRRTKNEIEFELSMINKKIRKAHFPNLIEDLEIITGNKLNLKQHILSINKIRNCLTHRYGIVREDDLNSEGVLELKWKKLSIMLASNDNKKEVKILDRIVINPGEQSKIYTQFKDTSKLFQKDEKIVLDYIELSDIFLTCFLFGKELLKIMPASDKLTQCIGKRNDSTRCNNMVLDICGYCEEHKSQLNM
jgi:hypothetical protein